MMSDAVTSTLRRPEVTGTDWKQTAPAHAYDSFCPLHKRQPLHATQLHNRLRSQCWRSTGFTPPVYDRATPPTPHPPHA